MADNTFVGAGHIYRAPLGTAFPEFTGDYANYATALETAGFTDVATVYSDGLGFTPTRESSNVSDWAGNVVRVLYTSHSEELTFTLIDWMDADVQKAAFGDKNVSSVANGTKTVFNNNAADDSAWCILIADGDKYTEFQVERGSASVGAMSFISTDVTKIPVTVKAIKGTGEDTVVVYTVEKAS